MKELNIARLERAKEQYLERLEFRTSLQEEVELAAQAYAELEEDYHKANEEVKKALQEFQRAAGDLEE